MKDVKPWAWKVLQALRARLSMAFGRFEHVQVAVAQHYFSSCHILSHLVTSCVYSLLLAPERILVLSFWLAMFPGQAAWCKQGQGNCYPCYPVKANRLTESKPCLLRLQNSGKQMGWRWLKTTLNCSKLCSNLTYTFFGHTLKSATACTACLRNCCLQICFGRIFLLLFHFLKTRFNPNTASNIQGYLPQFRDWHSKTLSLDCWLIRPSKYSSIQFLILSALLSSIHISAISWQKRANKSTKGYDISAIKRMYKTINITRIHEYPGIMYTHVDLMSDYTILIYIILVSYLM